MTVGTAALDPVALAAAVERCPSVAALHGGRFGEVTSYLPGQRIPGVAFRPDGIHIAITSTASATAGSLTTEITAVLAPLVGSTPVSIIWADITIDGP